MRAAIRQTTPAAFSAEHEELIAASAEADGAAPVGDGLRHSLQSNPESGPDQDGSTSVFELRAGDTDGAGGAGDAGDTDGALVGIAILGTDGERLTAELAVAPSARNRGHGRRLVRAVLAASESSRVWFWAHGDHPAAARLAAESGMERARDLLQLRLAADAAELPEPALPAGVVLRTFRPGQDDAEWVRVNNAAFSWHPEQGDQTTADIAAAEKEDDFDADGFFVAVAENDPGRILGFHWTKVHPGDDPLGEVFVLGVDPEAHSRGLGKALTITGLNYLFAKGISEVELYTEGDNAAALGLYRSLGFRDYAIDVSYTRR